MADAPDSGGGFKLEDSVSQLLHRALLLAEERFAVLSRDQGLTLRQFAVLAAVQAEPGVSQAELVRATSIDRSTLADIVARLETRGLIERSRAQDQRANAVMLTSAGAAALVASTTHAKAADAAILDLLSAPKGKALLATLTRIAKRAEEAAASRERAQRKAARRQARSEAKARERTDANKKAKRRKKSRESAKRSETQRKPVSHDETFVSTKA